MGGNFAFSSFMNPSMQAITPLWTLSTVQIKAIFLHSSFLAVLEEVLGEKELAGHRQGPHPHHLRLQALVSRGRRATSTPPHVCCF